MVPTEPAIPQRRIRRGSSSLLERRNPTPARRTRIEARIDGQSARLDAHTAQIGALTVAVERLTDRMDEHLGGDEHVG